MNKEPSDETQPCQTHSSGRLARLAHPTLANPPGPSRPAKQAGKSPVKVFILAGQSNMEGQAVVDLAGKDYNEGRGTLAALMLDPLKSADVQASQGCRRKVDRARRRVGALSARAAPLLAGPLSFGFSVYGDRHHFGPELQFGHVLGDHFENQVLLVKTAWGGKSLYKDFRPPSSGGKVGPYYTQMIAEVRAALANLKTDFPAYDGGGYELAGFVWYHGWNDGCEPKTAVPEYEQNLVNLIHDVRQGIRRCPNCPSSSANSPARGSKRPASGPRCARPRRPRRRGPNSPAPSLFVPTHDFVRKPADSPNPGHGHHEFGNAETYFLVGDALGKAMLRLLK